MASDSGRDAMLGALTIVSSNCEGGLAQVGGGDVGCQDRSS